MIVKLYQASLRVPALRRALWRFTYDQLVRHLPRPDWTCMNYGCVPDAAATGLPLTETERQERFPLGLYNEVIQGSSLKGKQVLEVGCGRGGGAAFLARHFGISEMVGLDYARGNIQICRTLHRSLGNLRFLQGDAEALPLPDASFDVVLNVESSHCYGSIQRFFNEVHRVLRPGGKFLYTDFRPAEEVPAWSRSLTEAGFTEMSRMNISQRVAVSLEQDAARRREFVETSIARWLRPACGEFVALPGSIIHRELKGGQLAYLRFLLERIG